MRGSPLRSHAKNLRTADFMTALRRSDTKRKTARRRLPQRRRARSRVRRHDGATDRTARGEMQSHGRSRVPPHSSSSSMPRPNQISRASVASSAMLSRASTILTMRPSSKRAGHQGRMFPEAAALRQHLARIARQKSRKVTTCHRTHTACTGMPAQRCWTQAPASRGAWSCEATSRSSDHWNEDPLAARCRPGA